MCVCWGGGRVRYRNSNNRIEQVNKFKYLGYIVNDGGKDMVEHEHDRCCLWNQSASERNELSLEYARVLTEIC